MYKILGLILLSLVSFGQSNISATASYKISADLNTNTKIINAKETVTWTNKTNTPTDELQFHLYLNAFKDAHSTFMNESNNFLKSRVLDDSPDKYFGSIYISRLIFNNQNLLKNISYIQPDDHNKDDKTVIKVKLNKFIQPNETINLTIDFRATLPKIFVRTGWANNDYFLVAQWFPKLGVFEQKPNQKAAWNCHQYHANTEFFADFGDYDVTLNVPKNFVVGASGQNISERNIGNNRKQYQFLAKKVIDFTWSASPHFKIFTENYKGINIKVLIQPEHQNQIYRYVSATKHANDYLGKHVGKYPHKTFTIIDPPFAGLASGGMEYPTLITGSSYWGLGDWAKFTELITIHEFTHQYFQGVLASNEFEQSYLDEGFTKYFECKIFNEYYAEGSQLNLFGFSLNDFAFSRYDYVSSKNLHVSPIYNNAWQYPGDSYHTLTYSKTAILLKNLEGILGQKNMDLIFKKYYSDFAFSHPDIKDFIQIVNEVANKYSKYKEMNWFFDQALYQTKVCDYEISEIVNAARKAKPSSNIIINRLGDMVLPTTIKVVFDDGKSQLITWEGEETYKKYSFNKRVKYAQIDPENKNYLDVNMINNSKSVSNPTLFGTKYGLKMMFWVQQLFFFFGGLI